MVQQQTVDSGSISKVYRPHLVLPGSTWFHLVSTMCRVVSQFTFYPIFSDVVAIVTRASIAHQRNRVFIGETRNEGSSVIQFIDHSEYRTSGLVLMRDKATVKV